MSDYENFRPASSPSILGYDGPPDFSAPQGTLVKDAGGLSWEQTAPGTAFAWKPFAPLDSFVTILWSSDNQPSTSFIKSATAEEPAVWAYNFPTIANPSAQSMHFTAFEVRNVFRPLGLIFPFIDTRTSSAGGNKVLGVKAALFECQYSGGETMAPWRVIGGNKNAIFQRHSSLTVNGPAFVPPAELASTDGRMKSFIVRPSRTPKLYVGAIYDNTLNDQNANNPSNVLMRSLAFGKLGAFACDLEVTNQTFNYSSMTPTNWTGLNWTSTSDFNNRTRSGQRLACINWGILAEVYI